jgi:ribosomal protein L32
MVTNGSDTTRLPFPANAANCSHLWEPVVEKTLENEDIRKLVFVQKCTMCGLIDKTIEEVTKDKTSLPKSECRHKWVDNTVALQSAFEQMRERTTWSKKDMKDFEPWFFRKTLVKVLICKECGETQTVVASNFDLGDQNELGA